MKNQALRIFSVIALVIFTVSLMSLTACMTTKTVGEQIDDSWITTKVKAKLAADPEVNPFNVDVDTLDGVVTLSGRVKTQDDKAEAEKLARDTEGVKSVKNNLQVGDSPRR